MPESPESGALSEAARALLAQRQRIPEALPGPQADPDRTEALLSFPQLTQWVFAQLHPDSPAFNTVKRISIRGSVNREALAAAFADVIVRHAVLRSSFEDRNGEPVQRIRSAARGGLDYLDWRGQGGTETIEPALRRHAERLFSLAGDDLARALLVQLAEDEWILQITIHHIAHDGWSGGILWHDLGVAYSARCAGAGSAGLPALALQYVDYAAWQRGLEGQPAFVEAERFWHAHLAGKTATLPLPTDRPRPPTPSGAVGQIACLIDADVVARLADFAAARRASVVTVTLAAFAVLLARRCAGQSALIGQTVANRRWAELEPLIGTFINMVPVAVQFDDPMTFATFLDLVRAETLQAYRHSEYPFGRLGRLLRPDGENLGRGLFDALFNFGNFPHRPWTFDGLEVTDLPNPHLGAVAAFHLGITPVDGRLRCVLDYDRDLFDDGTAERWLAGYSTLLETLSTAPDTAVHDLPIMGREEAAAVLRAGAGSDPAPPPPPVHRQIEARAADQPDAVAVVAAADGASLTYAELDRRANEIAHRLPGHATGEDFVVGVCLERSLESVAALLAVFKAGGTYLPLDPEYPAERIAWMVEDAGAHAVITERRLRPALTLAESMVVCLDDEDEPSARRPDAPVPDSVEPEAVAYIIYTSGATGRPKGVEVTHGALATHIREVQNAYDLRATDRVLQFASFSFDPSLEQVLAPLARGARVVLRERDPWFPDVFLAKCAELGLTVVDLPPPYWQQWAEAALEGAPSEAPAGLRLVVVGGDVMPPGGVRDWFAGPLASVRLLNAYGPTEATITAGAFAVPPDFGRGSARIPIGRPLGGRTMRIVDRHGRPTPVGVVGELVIGGPCLARGYRHQPDLTAERFVRDPLAASSDARLYHTGDAARYLADFNIDFLGRLDDQVKIRGFRIEPGEVEAALSSLPGVAAAAAVVREDVPGDPRLVAYVAWSPGHAGDVAQLRAAVTRTLPAYLVPSQVVALPALPVSPVGKIDRRALSALAPVTTMPDPPPIRDLRSAVEGELIRIWERLLGRHPVRRDDDFFALGGHSLLAMRMANELERAIGVRLPLSALFADATVAGLAQRLEEQGPRHDVPAMVTVQAGGARRPFFMVHGDATGFGLYCRGVARAFGPDVPMYAFPSRGPDDPSGAGTIEEMAAYNVAALREAQPRGPYRLGGYCHGGVVAYEMAQQLNRAGEQVEELILVDTWPGLGPWRMARLLARAAARLTTRTPEARREREADLTRRLGRYRRSREAPPLRSLASYPLRLLARRLASPRTRPEPARTTPAVPTSRTELLAFLDFQRHAVDRYAARPYAGPVTIVLAHPRGSAGRAAINVWRRLLDRFETIVVDAPHLGIIATHLPAIIAERLAALDRSAPPDGGGP